MRENIVSSAKIEKLQALYLNAGPMLKSVVLLTHPPQPPTFLHSITVLHSTIV